MDETAGKTRRRRRAKRSYAAIRKSVETRRKNAQAKRLLGDSFPAVPTPTDPLPEVPRREVPDVILYLARAVEANARAVAFLAGSIGRHL